MSQLLILIPVLKALSFVLLLLCVSSPPVVYSLRVVPMSIIPPSLSCPQDSLSSQSLTKNQTPLLCLLSCVSSLCPFSFVSSLCPLSCVSSLCPLSCVSSLCLPSCVSSFDCQSYRVPQQSERAQAFVLISALKADLLSFFVQIFIFPSLPHAAAWIRARH